MASATSNRPDGTGRPIRLALLVAGGVLGWLLFAELPAAAQEPPAQDVVPPVARQAPRASGGFFAWSDRARLGVFLRPVHGPDCEVASDARGECPTPPIVAGVVEGAPAAEAGVLPGDTLLSLDGTSLRAERGRRAMAMLREGVPVRLEVGRASGRREIQVTPTSRPMTGFFQMDGTAWRSTAPSDVRVFRFRDDEGGLAEFHFTPAPEAPGVPEVPAGFVVFREDDRGGLRVEFGRPDVEVLALDGRRIELAELERRVREAGDLEELGLELARISDGLDRIGVDVEAVRPAEAVRPTEDASAPRRLILENAPLARRLESVHREALTAARTRIESVRRLQSELARRGELPPAAAAGYGYVARSGAEPPAPPGAATRWSEALTASDNRLAGAEFRALTPELAEYFPVEAGLLVLRVIPETPADRLGLRGGDVVIEVGGHETPDILTFRLLVADSQASGSPLDVKWNRKGTVLRGSLGSR